MERDKELEDILQARLLYQGEGIYKDVDPIDIPTHILDMYIQYSLSESLDS